MRGAHTERFTVWGGSFAAVNTGGVCLTSFSSPPRNGNRPGQRADITAHYPWRRFLCPVIVVVLWQPPPRSGGREGFRPAYSAGGAVRAPGPVCALALVHAETARRGGPLVCSLGKKRSDSGGDEPKNALQPAAAGTLWGVLVGADSAQVCCLPSWCVRP
mgnify:CR=1 FL=1